MTDAVDLKGVAAGVAALSICESLLLAMGDLKIMGEKEAVGIISDAASAHRGAGSTHNERVLNLEVVAILERILSGGNSIRRPVE